LPAILESAQKKERRPDRGGGGGDDDASRAGRVVGDSGRDSGRDSDGGRETGERASEAADDGTLSAARLSSPFADPARLSSASRAKKKRVTMKSVTKFLTGTSAAWRGRYE
jgi:hypothetical protein